MSNTTARPLPADRHPPLRIMTCQQLASTIRRHAADAANRFDAKEQQQLEAVARRLDSATTRDAQIEALEMACALSRLGTHHKILVRIRMLAARAARRIDQRSEVSDG